MIEFINGILRYSNFYNGVIPKLKTLLGFHNRLTLLDGILWNDIKILNYKKE